MPFGQIGKTLGAEWKQMSENEKKVYEKKAAKAKKGARGYRRHSMQNLTLCLLASSLVQLMKKKWQSIRLQSDCRFLAAL